MFTLRRQPKRRVTQHDARAAIADVMSRFDPWRNMITLMKARAARPHDDNERAVMQDQCAEIRRELGEARAELIIRLAEANPRVSGTVASWMSSARWMALKRW
jgi:hypothetical protein